MEQFQIEEQSVCLRNEVILDLENYKVISDPVIASMAIEPLRKAKQLMNDAENLRKKVKQPYLDACRQIDSTVKEYCTGLETSYNKVNLLVASWQAEERKKEEEIRLQAAIKENNLRLEAEKLQNNLEEQGLLDKNSAQRIYRETEEKVSIVKQELKSQTTSSEEIYTRKQLTFEVTDLKFLFKNRPDLCIIQPDNAAIRAAIKKDRYIPGLAITETNKAILK
ncbi:MAG: hypothetical protein LLG40_06765 [Deltaproteobacteria bacterium]|nr:hypothetical protein [Deltaproteobacteria bacterium]